MEIEFIAKSLEETEMLASRLARLLKANTLITLEGNLGTGKTTFTQALARELQITETVTSPTFTIIKEYEGSYPFYHIDAYRLEHSEEDIGLDDYINGEGITVIEWAQFIADFLPEELLNIEIKYIDANSRRFIFRAEGDYYEGIVERLFQEDFNK